MSIIKPLLLISLLSLSLNAKGLNLWHAYRGKERKALEKVIKNYTKETGINVRMLAIPYDAFSKKLTASIPRGAGPDVFIFANDKIGQWVESNLLESLDYYFSNRGRFILNFFFKTTVDALVYKDSLYALPIAFKVPLLYYNKKFIDTPPKTFEELISISKLKMRENKNVIGLGYENTNYFFHSFLYFGFGAKLFNDKREVFIDSDESLKSFKYAKKLALEDKIMPQEITSAVITTLFNKNQLLFVINGPWFAGEISKDIEYGVTAIPTINNKEMKPYISIEGIFMNRYSKKKIDALNLIKYIAGKEGSPIRLKEGKQSVAVKSLYENSDNETLKSFKKQADLATPISNDPIMAYFWAPLSQALKKVIEQNVKPEVALRDAKKKIEKLLKK